MSVHSHTAMSDLVERRKPFIFYVRPSRAFLFIPFAGIALLLWGPFQFIRTVGAARFAEGFDDHPELWVLVALLLGGIALILRLAFPRRRSLSRLEVRHDHVIFVPRSFDRRMGESITEVTVPPRATEILLAKNSLEGLPDGYSLVILSASEPEREVRLKFLRVPDAQYCQTIAEGVTLATGLPLRLVTRRRSMDGTIQQADWSAPRRNNEIAALAVGAAPFAVGTVVALLRLRPQLVVGVGAACWLGQIFIAMLASRFGSRKQSSSIVLSVLSSLFIFGAVYGFSVLVAETLFREP
jgi:hypothetical protein